jgi:hypothetical protein
MALVRGAALADRTPSVRNFKAVRDDYGIPVYEVVSNREHARLFVFYDPDDGTLIGVGQYLEAGALEAEREIRPDARD